MSVLAREEREGVDRIISRKRQTDAERWGNGIACKQGSYTLDMKQSVWSVRVGLLKCPRSLLRGIFTTRFAEGKDPTYG